jgi:hypothetical protein
MIKGEKIGIGNVDFAVTSKIEQCPPAMMLRELTMNAIEAASKDPSGKGIIEFDIETNVEGMEGINKLSIWNNGYGMNSEELYSITSLNTSLNKVQSLDGNFGIGAKAASLSSNKKGLRYRSCRNGIVSEVLLHREGEGVEASYCRMADMIDDQYTTVFDVTEIVEEEAKYDTRSEWTQVVLCGNEKSQDTVVNPFNNNPEVNKQWIAQQLYYRFFDIPKNVEIKLIRGTHIRGSGDPIFYPIMQRLDKYEKHEAVYVQDGIKIHYFYDPPQTDDNSTSHTVAEKSYITGFSNGVTVVYRNEMYDLRVGKKWAAVSPYFGVPFKAKFFHIVIELPSTYSVRPEEYRTDLKYISDGAVGDKVSVEDFSVLVRQHRPEWFKEKISFWDKNNNNDEEVQKELQDLLNASLLRVKSLRLSKKGDTEVDNDGGRGANNKREVKDPTDVITNTTKTHRYKSHAADNVAPSDKPKKRASYALNVEKAPHIVFCETLEEVKEKDFEGKAARYYGGDENTIFINPWYPEFEAAKEYLETYYANYEDAELMRRKVADAVNDVLQRLIGKAVVYAKVKEIMRDYWTREDIEKAYSSESLSIAAHFWPEVIGNEMRSLSSKLKTLKEVA